MLSKNKIKLIKSLSQKKYRFKENLFIAEGDKIVKEFLRTNSKIITLICTKDFSERNSKLIPGNIELIIATTEEIKKCSLQKTPQNSLIICEIPERNFNYNLLAGDLIICLDNIQDPGNLGTIMRIADWFGIKTICVSENTVDVFNPKVVQASMGSVLRVNVYYTNLLHIISYADQNSIATFGTFLNGNNIYSENLPENGIFVMGNEGNGISKELEEQLKYKIQIPTANKAGNQTIDSLNVSVATAIICSEFRRGKLSNYSK